MMKMRHSKLSSRPSPLARAVTQDGVADFEVLGPGSPKSRSRDFFCGRDDSRAEALV